MSFWVIFCHFSTLATWKIKFLKLKKAPGDIIIWHICTIHENHMMYVSWDMEHNRQNFLSFWTVFCALSPPPSPSPRPYTLTTQKIKVLKKWKNFLEILSFYTNVHKWQSNDVWFLRYGACWTKFFVILYPFLPFYPPNNLKNKNFEKLKKSTRRYHHFTMVYQKSWSYAILFMRYSA